MQGYRVFFIGPDGHIVDHLEFWCRNDEEAQGKAMQLLDGRDIELWYCDRKIAEFRSPQTLS